MLVRNHKGAAELAAAGWDVSRGDLNDPAALAAALQGVSEVYHLASVVSVRSMESARRANVDGTDNLCSAAASQQIPPRLLYVSSLAAAGPEVGGQMKTEADPCDPRSFYGRSKLEAESVVRGWANRIEATIVRPPGVFGPGDQNLLQLFRSVRAGFNFVAVSAELRYSFVYVDDLIEGMIRAMEQGSRLPSIPDAPDSTQDGAGRGVYFLADPTPMTFVEMANRLAELLGRRPPRHVTLPAPVCWCVATAPELWGRLTGAKTYLNFDKIREATAGSWTCSPARAQRELRFGPARPLRERLADTHAWYVERGMLAGRG